MNSRYGKIILAQIIFMMGIFFISDTAAEREYQVACEKISWDYAHSDQNLSNPDAGLGVWGKSLNYKKYRYIGYIDSSYATRLQQAE